MPSGRFSMGLLLTLPKIKQDWCERICSSNAIMLMFWRRLMKLCRLLKRVRTMTWPNWIVWVVNSVFMISCWTETLSFLMTFYRNSSHVTNGPLVFIFNRKRQRWNRPKQYQRNSNCYWTIISPKYHVLKCLFREKLNEYCLLLGTKAPPQIKDVTWKTHNCEYMTNILK